MKPSHPPLDVKKKPLTKPQQPPKKPVPKITEIAQKVTKEVSKKPEPNKQEPKKPQLKKPEPKMQEPKKQEPAAPNIVKATPTSAKQCGHYELNALMTRMLDVELRDLMRKTFRHLVDAPADDAERFVVEVIRKEAAPDLRTVLGLNVTKRLLNVFNPLFVKIKFNGKPEKEELREFLKKYNFIGFSRVAANIFAAQVRDIERFDRLCTDKDVRCGSVKVFVTPGYKFTICPPNLKTKYKDAYLQDYDTDNEKNDMLNINIESPEKQTNVSPKKLKSETIKLETAKEEKTKEIQSTLVSKNINKMTQNITNKDLSKKQEPSVVIKQENKVVTPSKIIPKITSPQKQSTVAPTAKTTPVNTVTKLNTTKTVAQASPVKIVTKVNPTKAAIKVAPIKTPTKVVPTKGVSKIPPYKSAPKGGLSQTWQHKFSKFVSPRKSTDDEDDYDELDDHDILALMSEGIVLDECCGSDED